MSVATLPLDILGLVFTAVQPPSARRRLPEVCKHWCTAFNSSSVLWSDVRANFTLLANTRLAAGVTPTAAGLAVFNRRFESLAAWLARRAGLVRSLHIEWPSQHIGVSLPDVLQQRMPHLTSLTIMCSERISQFDTEPYKRLEDLAGLASHQTQLTALTFGRRPGHTYHLPERPATAWLSSLQQHLQHLQLLHLPGFALQPGTAAGLSQLTGLSSLAVSFDSFSAQLAFQAALQQLSALTSLSVTLPAAAAATYWQPGEQFPSLNVGGLPRLETLRLSRGGMQGLSAVASTLTWLQLDDTTCKVEDLFGCSRLVGLEAKLHHFNACLDRFYWGYEGPGEQRELPPNSMPALRTLSLRAVATDIAHEYPGFLPEELSAFTALASLTVEGPSVWMMTPKEWKVDQYETQDQFDGHDCDSDTLELQSLDNHLEVFSTLRMPDPGFCPPRLRELSLLNCGLRVVPEFVAGLPELHILCLNGNAFDSVGDREIFPGLPGPVCSSLRRLEMRRCFLPAVPPRLSLLTALTALDLSSNQQLEFQRSDAGIFSRLTSLRELRLAKPPSPIHKRMEWSQESVAALLAVQRACSWLDLSQAMEQQEEER